MYTPQCSMGLKVVVTGGGGYVGRRWVMIEAVLCKREP